MIADGTVEALQLSAEKGQRKLRNIEMRGEEEKSI